MTGLRRGAVIFLAAAALVAGMLWVLRLRFVSGDVYPEGSSLRADAVGAKLLYDSLQPLVKVRRNYQSLETLDTRDATILFLDLPAGGFAATPLRTELERLARRGNRIVLAFREQTALFRKGGLQQIWHPNEKREAWKELVPSIVERRLDRGSVVLVQDATLLHNFWTAKYRNPSLLARILGPHSTVIFDESHLGVQQTGSVAALLFRYRLHGLLAGLALCAALVIWRNASSFPPSVDGPHQATVSGRDSLSGFISLLRRNLTPRQAAGAAWQQWQKTAAARYPETARTRAADLWRSASHAPPLDTLQKAHHILHSRDNH